MLVRTCREKCATARRDARWRWMTSSRATRTAPTLPSVARPFHRALARRSRCSANDGGDDRSPEHRIPVRLGVAHAAAYLGQTPADVRQTRFFVSPPDGWGLTTAPGPTGASPASLAVSPAPRESRCDRSNACSVPIEACGRPVLRHRCAQTTRAISKRRAVARLRAVPSLDTRTSLTLSGQLHPRKNLRGRCSGALRCLVVHRQPRRRRNARWAGAASSASRRPSRRFVHIIASDPSRIELPHRCLPFYLLNGRQVPTSAILGVAGIPG